MSVILFSLGICQKNIKQIQNKTFERYTNKEIGRKTNQMKKMYEERNDKKEETKTKEP